MNISVSYEDFISWNLYNTTFSIKLISGDFSGISEFEYNIKEVIHFVKEIKELYDFKLNQVELN